MTGLPQTVLDAMRSHLSSGGDKSFIPRNGEAMAAEEGRSCIVCGESSHRTSWDKETKDGAFVACDSHSDKEFADAVKAATPAPALVK